MYMHRPTLWHAFCLKTFVSFSSDINETNSQIHPVKRLWRHAFKLACRIPVRRRLPGQCRVLQHTLAGAEYTNRCACGSPVKWCHMLKYVLWWTSQRSPNVNLKFNRFISATRIYYIFASQRWGHMKNTRVVLLHVSYYKLQVTYPSSAVICALTCQNCGKLTRAVRYFATFSGSIAQFCLSVHFCKTANVWYIQIL